MAKSILMLPRLLTNIFVFLSQFHTTFISSVRIMCLSFPPLYPLNIFCCKHTHWRWLNEWGEAGCNIKVYEMSIEVFAKVPVMHYQCMFSVHVLWVGKSWTKSDTIPLVNRAESKSHSIEKMLILFHLKLWHEPLQRSIFKHWLFSTITKWRKLLETKYTWKWPFVRWSIETSGLPLDFSWGWLPGQFYE